MKPTPAQLAIIHVVESAAISLVLTVVMAVYQSVATHGLDFAALANTAGLVFLGSLGMIYKSVLGNPNFAQAGNDTLTQLVTALHDKFDQMVPFLHTHPVPSQPPQGGSVIAPSGPVPTPQPAQPAIAPQFTLPQALPQFTAPIQAVQPQQGQ